MTRLASVLQSLQKELAGLHVEWALVGGLAVSVRADPRFTRDVDVAIMAIEDTAAEQLVFALGNHGYTVVATVEHTSTGRLATARLVPPGEPEGGILVDLIFASSGIEPEVVAAADTMEIFPGVTVPVCTTAHLLVLKILARDDESRPQDRVDLVALMREMGPDDWVEADRAIDLIGVRGYDRDRDLVAAMNDLRGGCT